MEYKSIEDIKNSYCYDNKMLIVHYAAVTGEIPVWLISELGISNDLRNYIINRSPYKDFFIYRKGQQMTGYQLNSQGINHLLSDELINDYYPFIISSGGNTVKPTKDIAKRARAHSYAQLYYLFDKIGLPYLPKQSKNHSNKCFYPTPVLKHSDIQANGHIENANREKHEIKSSRMFGLVKSEDDIYATYIFNKEIPQLDTATEQRAKEILNTDFKTNKLTHKDIQCIIFVKDEEAQQQITVDIINSFYGIENRFKISKFSFFRNIDYKEIHIIPIEEEKTRQFNLLFNRSRTEQMILSQLDKRNNKREYTENIGIVSDYCFCGNPLIFLYSLDLVKLRQFYVGMREYEHLKGYIVCERKLEAFLKDIFSPVGERVNIIVV